MGYTKLFTDIVASSIWDEDDKTRIVWITLLALKDRNHFVRGTANFLALASRVKFDECERAVKRLSSPDAHSRTPDFEGRRIEPVPGGWRILNGEKYSRMLSKEERAEYNRNKQAEYRRRKKQLREGGAKDGAQRALTEGFGKGTDS